MKMKNFAGGFYLLVFCFAVTGTAQLRKVNKMPAPAAPSAPGIVSSAGYVKAIGQVKITDDEFEPEKTVRLTRTVFAADAAFELEASVPKRNLMIGEKSTWMVTLYLELKSDPNVKYSRDSRDGSINFLVDGTRVSGGDLSWSSSFDQNKNTPFAVLKLTDLFNVGEGKKVQVKIADRVYELAPDVIEAIQEFVRQVRQ